MKTIIKTLHNVLSSLPHFGGNSYEKQLIDRRYGAWWY